MILLHFISTVFINVKLCIFFLHLFVLWVILFTSSFLSGFSKKKKKKDCARMSVIAYALKHAI